MKKQVMELAWKLYRKAIPAGASFDRKMLSGMLKDAWAICKGEFNGNVQVIECGDDFLVDVQGGFVGTAFQKLFPLAGSANDYAQMVADTLGIEAGLFVPRTRRIRRSRKSA